MCRPNSEVVPDRALRADPGFVFPTRASDRHESANRREHAPKIAARNPPPPPIPIRPGASGRIESVCRGGIPEAAIWGVLSFYSLTMPI